MEAGEPEPEADLTKAGAADASRLPGRAEAIGPWSGRRGWRPRGRMPARPRRFCDRSRAPVVDWRATIRRRVRTGLRRLNPARRPRRLRPRRLIIFWDVSASKREFLPVEREWLFRYGEGARVVPFGLLPARPGDAAVWHGGTAIGESLSAWWHDQRRLSGLAGARAAIWSDGWDTSPAEVLVEALANLRRAGVAIWWVTPWLSSPGYEPKTRALVAARPFLEGILGSGSLPELDVAMRRIWT